MGSGSSREDRAGHGCSAGVSPEQHREQKRPQGLQQQWDTQGLKGSSFSSLGLAPLRSRKCCWYRAPWGDGTGWDGGNQLNMRMLYSKQPRESVLHLPYHTQPLGLGGQG